MGPSRAVPGNPALLEEDRLQSVSLPRGIKGEVKGIGIRASRVRTWQGAEVIVPNGDLVSQQVTYWTPSDRLRRVEINVGVKYGTDPQRVIDLPTGAVNQNPEVSADPSPHAVFKGFGSSSQVRRAPNLMPARPPGVRDLAGCCEIPEQKNRTALSKPY